MRRVAVALTTAALLAMGVITAPLAQAAPPGPAATPDFTPAPVTWGPCTDIRLAAANAECGFVTVPLDYAQPKGAVVQLAVSRVKHTVPTAQYQGVMLVNPGGPGGSGLVFSLLAGAVPNAAGASYDWIGFDPRGVGSSKPALSCSAGYAGYDRPYYIPDTAKDEAAWLKKSAAYTATCAAKGKALLQHITTVDSAKDMDSIRKALGQKQISYYGFSYGTYLGSVYATLYPQNVRRMVLDGNVDPRGIWEQDNYDQDVAFEKTISVFFGWVAKYDSIYHLGTTEAAVEKVYYDQYRKLRTAPAGGKIGSSEWNDIFLQAGYYVFGWESIATAFSNWVNKADATGLVNLFGAPPFDDNGYAIYLGVECTDTTWSSYPEFRKENAELYSEAPFETWPNGWFNAPCTFWPAKASTPVKIDGSKAPPLLLIDETLDAATPYSGSLELRKRFPKSSLIEGVGGTTHAGSLSGVACTDDTVASYLATGVTPERVAGNRSDKQCAPVPQPVPTALTSATTMAQSGAAKSSVAPGVAMRVVQG
jgi:pimeloyl-ACP methyl ester carboxylesterase